VPRPARVTDTDDGDGAPTRRTADGPIPDGPAAAGEQRPSAGAAPRAAAGTWLVVGLVCLGVVAGAVAIAYQRGQTRRCLDFYGADVARLVATAPRVEMWTLAPADAGGADAPARLRAVARRDVSQAAGLVHLRRGLVEDANFRWSAAGSAGGRLPAGAWDVALAFSDPERDGAEAILVIDTGGDEGPASGGEGALAVVGRRGRIGLGRIAGGLRKWLDDPRRER